MKHQYIDSTRIDEIMAQLYLLSKHDATCVLIVKACSKVVKVYTVGGFYMFFTDKNTNRKATSWGGAVFKEFAESSTKCNQVFDEAYISVFSFDGENYFVEHNEILDEEDIRAIMHGVEEYE